MWTTGLTVTKITDRDRKKQQDQLVLEKKLSIVLNTQRVCTLYCSPQQEKELAIGYLKTRGYIHSYEDIQKISLSELNEVHVLTQDSGHSAFQAHSSISISPTDIFRLTAQFQEKALLFKKTAITHSAAIASCKSILAFSEDVYRLSALDKAVGQWLQTPSPDSFLFITSSKVDVNMMNKIKTLGLKLVVSRTAPTTQAYQLAMESKIALVGFARGKRLNLYTPFLVLA